MIHGVGGNEESFKADSSHVIHLVSKVSGTLQAANDGTQDSVSIVADTFPAGTLSGAPKYMAMTLIDRYERGARGFYGGAVGSPEAVAALGSQASAVQWTETTYYWLLCYTWAPEARA